MGGLDFVEGLLIVSQLLDELEDNRNICKSETRDG